MPGARTTVTPWSWRPPTTPLRLDAEEPDGTEDSDDASDDDDSEDDDATEDESDDADEPSDGTEEESAAAGDEEEDGMGPAHATLQSMGLAYVPWAQNGTDAWSGLSYRTCTHEGSPDTSAHSQQ